MFDEFAQWLKDLLLWLPLKIWEMITDGLAGVLEAIPVPDFINQAKGFMGGIPGNVLWVLDLFAVPQGMTMIMSALLLRFLVRRIPLIG